MTNNDLGGDTISLLSNTSIKVEKSFGMNEKYRIGKNGYLSDVSFRPIRVIIFIIILSVFFAVWKFPQTLKLQGYSIYGLSISDWAQFFMILALFIVVGNMVMTILFDILADSSVPGISYFLRISKRCRLLLKISILSLLLLLLYDRFFPVDCENVSNVFLSLDDKTDSQGCKLAFIRKLILCLITTPLGLVIVQCSVITISYRYQESVLNDRVLLNRYRLYVANLLFEGCIEEGERLGATLDDFSMSQLSVDSALIDDVDEDDKNISTPKYLSSIRKYFSHKAGEDSETKDSPHSSRRNFLPDDTYFYPLLDFNVFRKSAKSSRIGSMMEKLDAERITLAEAKRRASFVFYILSSLSVPKKNYITTEDIQRIFKTKSLSAVQHIFDLNHDGEMTYDEMVNSFIRIYKEHNNLRKSVLSSASVLGALDGVLSGVMLMLLMLVYLVIFGLDVQSLLALSVSVTLGFNAIIGNTLRETFDSLIFLFVTHPYDIGDKIVIEGDPNIYEVKQIFVLRTEFYDPNGEEVYFSNPALIKKKITNMRRSHEQWESMDISLDSNSPNESLRKLRGDLTDFLIKHPDYYYPKFEMESITVFSAKAKTSSVDVYPIRIRVQCKLTLDNMKKSDGRHFLLMFIRKELESLRISYHPDS